MLKLSTKGIQPLSATTSEGIKILRVTKHLAATKLLRSSYAYVGEPSSLVLDTDEFGAYLFHASELPTANYPQNSYLLPSEFEYLSEGDVIRIDFGKRALKVLYRTNASINAFLLTERCNSFCLMCSQPPRDIDDSYRVEELHRTISLMSPSTREIVFSGGEPTLLGTAFLELLICARDYLPRTAVHVLTNGRNFKTDTLAIEVARIRHPDLMFGIPLYSDVSDIHDYVVQARGAFDETIRGILNLKRASQKVELRVVIHNDTYKRLPQLADFIVRNLLFVDQVALMGLELMGFGKVNARQLWVDPIDYSAQLVEATRTLSRAGMRVLIFNHQLCTLPDEIRPYAVKSISDWKREYVEECTRCSKNNECGGFFSSVVEHQSRGIRAI